MCSMTLNRCFLYLNYKHYRLNAGADRFLCLDCNLFSQLYIASKFRDGNLHQFFSHENNIYPPALSKDGKLNLPSQKSDLLGLIAADTYPPVQSSLDVKIIDGAAIAHALPVDKLSTFGEYASDVFLPWIELQLKTCDRVDIVWDVYKNNRLKNYDGQILFHLNVLFY